VSKISTIPFVGFVIADLMSEMQRYTISFNFHEITNEQAFAGAHSA